MDVNTNEIPHHLTPNQTKLQQLEPQQPQPTPTTQPQMSRYELQKVILLLEEKNKKLSEIAGQYRQMAEYYRMMAEYYSGLYKNGVNANVDMGVGTGIKFGFGFSIGVALFFLTLGIVVIMIIITILSSLLSF